MTAKLQLFWPPPSLLVRHDLQAGRLLHHTEDALHSLDAGISLPLQYSGNKGKTWRYVQRTRQLPLPLQTSQEAMQDEPFHQVLDTDWPGLQFQLCH